jgi:hypothetical protein
LGYYQLVAVPYHQRYNETRVSLSGTSGRESRRRLSIVESVTNEPPRRMSLAKIDHTLKDQGPMKEVHIGLDRMSESHAIDELYRASVDVHRASLSPEEPYIPIPPLPKDYVNANLPVNIRILHTELLSISIPHKKGGTSWFQDEYVEIEIIPQDEIELSKNITSDGLIIYFHGGGFISMTSFSHEMYTRKWALDTGKILLMEILRENHLSFIIITLYKKKRRTYCCSRLSFGSRIWLSRSSRRMLFCLPLGLAAC